MAAGLSTRGQSFSIIPTLGLSLAWSVNFRPLFLAFELGGMNIEVQSQGESGAFVDHRRNVTAAGNSGSRSAEPGPLMGGGS